MTLAEEDGAEDKLIKSLVGEAVKAVFGRYADPDEYEQITEQFKGNLTFPPATIWRPKSSSRT